MNVIICRLVFVVYLLIIALIDLRKKKIKGGWILLGGGIVSLKNVVDVFGAGVSDFSVGGFVAGFLPGIILLLLSISTKKIGIGDGLILCWVGAMENYRIAVSSLVFSSLISFVVAICLLVFRRVNKETRLPFLPFLSLGYLVTIFLF